MAQIMASNTCEDRHGRLESSKSSKSSLGRVVMNPEDDSCPQNQQPRQHQRQVRRRQVCKVNQRRYRERKRQHEQSIQDDIKELQDKIARARSLNFGLRQNLLSHCANHAQFRQDTMTRYFTLFHRGVTSRSRSDQLRFLEANTSANFQLQGPEYPPGPVYLLKQWQRYSLMFPNLKIDFQLVTSMCASGEVVQGHVMVHLPITRRMLEKLYPHVMYNAALVQHVVGKTLHHKHTQTMYFGDQGKVEFMYVENRLAEAWKAVLAPSFFTAETLALIMGQSKIENHLIQTQDEELEELIRAQDRLSLVDQGVEARVVQLDEEEEEEDHHQEQVQKETKLRMNYILN